MELDEFFKIAAPKIGANNAFNLARDARLQTLEKILIKKCGVIQEDLDAALNAELKSLSDKILNMPSESPK